MIQCAYFSATGTTEKIACRFSETLGKSLNMEVKTVNFTTPEKRKSPLLFKDDIVVTALPTVAGRLPNLMLPYLKEMRAENCLGIPIVLYGNRNFDDSLMELAKLMENAGIKVIACGAFVGEHSFSDVLAKGRPDSSDMKDAENFANEVAKKIKSDNLSPCKVPGQFPLRDYFKPQDRYGKHIDIRKVKPKTKSSCTDCKTCVSLCPLGSIDYNDVSRITGICMKCCACVKKCPAGAKYFDDPGFLYHKKELEEVYGDYKKNQWFV